MLRNIGMLLMPDLSTSGEDGKLFCAVFPLARAGLHVSFKSSDDRDAGTSGYEGWLQDQPEENDRIDEEIDR